jgi:hypothetical protein
LTKFDGIYERRFCKCLIRLAPEVGLEPTTLRLTAECSAIELLRSVHGTQRELRCASSVITNAANWVKDIQRSCDALEARIAATYCSDLGVKQDGYVVAGEGTGRWIRTCSYDGLVVSAGVEFVLEFGG